MAKTSRKKTRPARRKSTSPSILKRLPWVKLLLGFSTVFLVWLVYLDAVIVRHFEGKRWEIPSRVYARPLEVFDGAPLTADGLKFEMSLLNYASVASPTSPGSYRLQGNSVEIQTREFAFSDGIEPSRRLRFRLQGDRVADLSMQPNASTALVRLEPAEIGILYPAHQEDRVLIQLDDVPPYLRSGLIQVEDRDFETHFGISPWSMLRALVANVRAGHVVQGGSTLTQQLVKNFYLTQERSLLRKVNEAFMALLLDWHYSKDEILEAYLNEVYLGQSGKRAIHGFGLASQFYFGRPLRELEVQQVALMIGLVKGPGYYDPRRNPERAKTRRDLVLRLMAEAGVISEARRAAAAKRELGVVDRPSFSENRYPAFIDLVKRHLVRDYDEEELRSSGLRVFTTLDPQLQRRAEQSVADVLPRLDRAKTPTLEAASVFANVGSGEILAMTGGRDARYAGFNRAIDARRPIGSLVKPAVYLAALREPERYGLATLVSDEAFRLKLENGDVWEPQNYDHQVHGKVPLMLAMANSYNLAAARIGIDVGLPKVAKAMEDIGFLPTPPYYPSITLGTTVATPMDVAEAYLTLASGGFRMPLRTIREVTTTAGEVLSRYPLEVRQTIDPRHVFLLQQGMIAVMQEGTGRSVARSLPNDLVVAGKTGTSNDGRDAWFAGFSADYLGVVWVGRDDNQSTKLTGATGALPVWTGVMARQPQYSFEPVVPDGVSFIRVDDSSWQRTSDDCSNGRRIPYLRGSEPAVQVTCRSIPGFFQQLFDRFGG